MTKIARLAAIALVGASALMPSMAVGAGMIGIYMPGEELYNNCRAYLKGSRNGDRLAAVPEAFSAGLCYGFVVGVMDLNAGLTDLISADNQPPYCTREANARSITEAVALYLEQHPEERDKAGFFLVRKILAEKFPC